MAAIGKSGFLADISKIQVGKAKQLEYLIDADKFNIFLAGLVVSFAKQFCKVRVAHITLAGKLLNPQGFIVMMVNILCDFIKRPVSGGSIFQDFI